MILRGFLYSRVESKTQCSPTYTFLNSFSLLTLPTNNIMCKSATSLHAKPPSLAQKMPKSSISSYCDSILEKRHDMPHPAPTFFLGICFGTASDRIRGQTSHCLSSAVLHEIRAWFCLFFGPLYKFAFQKRPKGI